MDNPVPFSRFDNLFPMVICYCISNFANLTVHRHAGRKDKMMIIVLLLCLHYTLVALTEGRFPVTAMELD